MTPETTARLLALNRRFYEEYGGSFSDTRLRLQPGVQCCLASIPPAAAVLDLGCGNGNALAELVRRGHRGPCYGIDSSRALLAQAEQLLPAGGRVAYLQADLAEKAWEHLIPSQPFDFILAFAVFHHLPGAALRRDVIEAIHRHLKPGGLFIHSHWQFQNSARLMERVQPWTKAGFNEADLEPGDTLLDWRRGGQALRYVHLTTPETLREMALATGFTIRETFASDGEGGNLGLYSIWEYNQG